MQDAKLTRWFYFLHSLPPPATLLSRSRLGLCTPVDIRWKIGPKISHFFSLFGPPGVIPRCQNSISKSFRAKQIGAASWPSQAVKHGAGLGPRNSHFDFH